RRSRRSRSRCADPARRGRPVLSAGSAGSGRRGLSNGAGIGQKSSAASGGAAAHARTARAPADGDDATPARAPGSGGPREFRALIFPGAGPRSRAGSDPPGAYLERCLETIAAREPVVRAFAALNEAGAREAADASSARWKAGRPLSPIDGMPIGIKDLLETKDMPTQMGCEAFRGHFPKRDHAAV